MRILVTAALCAGLLSGCGILGGSDMADSQPSVAPGQQQAAADDAICRSYGTYPGSTPYVQCRLGLRKQHSDQADDSPLGSLFGN